MIRFILALGAVAGAIVLNSCCCVTSEANAPKLRPLPQFQPVPAAPEVSYQK
jgi:hypothetical protein